MMIFFSGTGLCAKEYQKPIVVLVTSYNNAKWVRMNLASVALQKYNNFRIIYVNDCSSDKTGQLVEDYIEKLNLQDKTIYISNSERKGALHNIYDSIHNLIEDDEIVVSLDGDDWFSSRKVLKKINECYCSDEVWLTHGTLREFPSGSTKWCQPVPPDAISENNYRKYRCPSHLRTFYAWLFKKIRREDLTENEEFYQMSWDQAIMFPMIEMAAERHRFIREVLYVYNMANVLNDNKVDPEYQRALEARIRSKTPYERLIDKESEVDELSFESNREDEVEAIIEERCLDE